MIIEDLKADLSEAAQNKLKETISDMIESKLQREIKKIAKKLTVKFIIAGVAMAGAFLLAGSADKVVDLVTKSKD